MTSFADRDRSDLHHSTIQRSPSLSLPLNGGRNTSLLARRSFLSLAAAAALAVPRTARAQLALNRPIRIIVPFAPAGSSDVLARLLQSPLQQALGQTVIVENRAGAGANIGMVEAARAEPDGYTLLLTSSPLVVNPALYKNVAYDPAKDFAPIATLPVAPNILAANAKGSIKSLSEVVARAKAEPDKLNYASPGNGTTPQLAMELFKLKAGVDITNIPFNGGGPATQALLTGTVDLLLTALPGAQAQVQAGVMRGLAVTTKERWVNLPDVPTFKEAGFPDVTLEIRALLAGASRDAAAASGAFHPSDPGGDGARRHQEPCHYARLYAGRRRTRRGPRAHRQKRAVFQTAHRQRQNPTDRVTFSLSPLGTRVHGKAHATIK
jgi:tripartite-type tricarboxylate transporter receptor subunit TctC